MSEARDPGPGFHADEGGDYFIDDYGQVLGNLHHPSLCEGRPCVVHSQSDHPLRGMRLRRRVASRLIDIKPSHFERICEHGVGHPDPDAMVYHERVGEEWMGIHGCDGCCGDKPSPAAPD